MDEGLYRENLNIDIIAKLYIGESMLIVEADVFPPKDFQREALFNEFINYHIHGMASSKGLRILKKYTKKKLK